MVAAGHALAFIAPLNLTLAVAAAVLRGFGIALCFCCSFAMIADCVGMGSGRLHSERRGSSSVPRLWDKNSVRGIASAIVGGLLNGAGYDGTLAVQSPAAEGMITNIYLFTPILCFGIIAVFMLFYKLDVEMPGIMRDLEARKEKSRLTKKEVSIWIRH